MEEIVTKILENVDKNGGQTVYVILAVCVLIIVLTQSMIEIIKVIQ